MARIDHGSYAGDRMFEERSFGTYLKYQRELRGMSLDHVCSVTKISRSLLDALEHDDVSKWPTGIFRRGFFRGYASTIGLDPDPLMDDFARLFARPTEKVRRRIASAEFHRPHSTLRLTLASEELRTRFTKADVVPALLDGLLMLSLPLLVIRVGGGHVAVGVAAAALYHAVPRVLGWQTLGAAFVARVTSQRLPALRARTRENAAARPSQTSAGLPEPRLVIRSRRAG